jgi:hypothetical protein
VNPFQHNPRDHHDPFEGLTPQQTTFLQAFEQWVFTNFPYNPDGTGGPPITLEISNGMCTDRLGLNMAEHEVVLLKRRPVGIGRRAVGIEIMLEDEAQARAVLPADGYPVANPVAVLADPCVVWKMTPAGLVCMGYGDG